LFGSAALLVAAAAWLWLRPADVKSGIWACGSPIWEFQSADQGNAPRSDGKITIDMNNLPPDDPRMPRGGSYIYAGSASILQSTNSTPQRVTWFDAACDALVVDGQPLSGDVIPPGLTVADARSGEGVSMVLRFGDYNPDGAVVLRGVAKSIWAAGAAQQRHGTAGPDAMVGDSSDEVLVPGAGPDTIAPAGGNDRVVYSFGDLTILSTPPNSGQDTLNLSRYKLDDIGIVKEGDDLLLSTTEGTIRIQNQLSVPDNNIETLLLADKEKLDMTEIPALLAQRAAN
jgi:hypothetical protein